MTRFNTEIDVTQALPVIGVPTLVLHRTDDLVPIELGHYVAEHVPGARFVELAGRDHMPWVGDSDAVVDEVEQFLTGERRATESDRVLATVLFTDIAGSLVTGSGMRFDDRGLHSLKAFLANGSCSRSQGRVMTVSQQWRRSARVIRSPPTRHSSPGATAPPYASCAGRPALRGSCHAHSRAGRSRKRRARDVASTASTDDALVCSRYFHQGKGSVSSPLIDVEQAIAPDDQQSRGAAQAALLLRQAMRKSARRRSRLLGLVPSERLWAGPLAHPLA